MKKILVYFFVLLLFFVSCDNGTEEILYGSLKVSASDVASKTIEPTDGDLAIATHVVKGVHSDNPTLTFEQSFTGDSVTVDSLLVGTWSVYVEGYNADGVLIAQSNSMNVEIQPAKTASAAFQLGYIAEGRGIAVLTVKVTDTLPVEKVEFTVGSATYTVTKPSQAINGYFEFTKTLEIEAGSSLVRMTMYRADDVQFLYPAVEALSVYSDLTSEKVWTYSEDMFAKAPTTSVTEGTVAPDTQVSLSTGTSGATILYTIDGTAPTLSSLVYSSPITISKNATVKAIAIKANLYVSEVMSAEYHVKAASPAASVEAGTYASAQSVSLSTSTEGSAIYYTLDGSEPTTASFAYQGAIAIDRNTVLKAVAVNDDFDNSEVTTVEYKVKAAVPASSVPSGSYGSAQEVALSCATPESTIYYTLDGTDPDETSNVYDSPIAINATCRLKAVAKTSNHEMSDVLELEITISTEKVGAIMFTPAAGTVYETTQVVLSAAEGTTIYYTTDGSTPTLASTVYNGPIALDARATVKAFAAKYGYANSDVVSATYTFKVTSPSFSVEEGSYNEVQDVVLSTVTPDAAIYYTTDGSVPTVATGMLYTGAVKVSKTRTIKAIAVRTDWEDSEVSSVSYTIDGLAGFSVTDPVKYSLSIDASHACALIPVLTPSRSDVEYTWYVDGRQVSKTYEDNLIIGGETGVKVDDVQHEITLVASFNGTVLAAKCSSDEIGTLDHNRVDNVCTLCGILCPYRVSSTGPAGGIIFYDCDADNETGNADGLISTECGWRYLEAAPEDLKVGSTTAFIFGYYRTSSSENNLYVNGTTSYVKGTSDSNDGKSTGIAIGTGKANTAKLVKAMGSTAYTSSSRTDITDQYAAKLADDYVYGGYDDWFLPSQDELNLMYSNLHKAGLGGFASGNYWSSSEYGVNASTAWRQAFSSGGHDNYARYYNFRLRCVRAF